MKKNEKYSFSLSLETGFSLSAEQQNVIDVIYRHITERDFRGFIIVHGLSRTGKTSLIKPIAKLYKKTGGEVILTAPGFIASQHTASITGLPVDVLQDILYEGRQECDDTGFPSQVKLIPKEAYLTSPGLIIIDEANLLSVYPQNFAGIVSEHSMLEDLIRFYNTLPQKSILLLLGDKSKIPQPQYHIPVALDSWYLLRKHKILVSGHVELKRQAEWFAAEHGFANTQQNQFLREFDSTIPASSHFIDLSDPVNAARRYKALFRRSDTHKIITVAWRNETVDTWNKLLRRHLFPASTGPVCTGDRLIVQRGQRKPNLFYSGQFLHVLSCIGPVEQVENLQFQQIEIEYQCLKGKIHRRRVMLCLSFLTASKPFLDEGTLRNLFHNRRAQNDRLKETGDFADDPYLSALYVRYGYAITLHRAQGGRWDHVIIDPEILSHSRAYAYTASALAGKSIYSFFHTDNEEDATGSY
ncbi:MAG: AAA family ATPase [Bacteroidales bacterium]|nr:AAA family ATPase [Bacteroidales bacterium]MDD2323557.1 AAA family ATPase [Bacteroidales bacterium]MDD3962450.1 AAA family ATPase [Bacteroidales bacterium]MDY0284890.1 AAA family ATPase [Bacteroidales bacterium]